MVIRDYWIRWNKVRWDEERNKIRWINNEFRWRGRLDKIKSVDDMKQMRQDEIISFNMRQTRRDKTRWDKMEMRRCLIIKDERR